MVCGFYVQEHPKAQPAVVLVLKRLRRGGHGLKSPQTDWEKPGIEPTTPGLQDIHIFVAFLSRKQFRRVGLRYVLVLRREHPKAHQKWFYGEARNRTCAWIKRHRLIPYTKNGQNLN